MIAITWAGFGFQFAASRDPSLGLQTDLPIPVGIDNLFVFASRHHLLPDSFCVGFIRQHTAIRNTPNFLLGEQSGRGWWYYYPFAFLVKTPLAAVIAIALALICATRIRKRRRIFGNPWTAISLLVPAGGFFICAMGSSYNHGIRSILPVYPMLFIAVGVIFARAVELRPRIATITGTLLLAGLMVETSAAFPNYISFFNCAAGGSRGGLQLLGDSNLDWGQDLTAIIKWQHEHPDTRLYLGYFGEVDPRLIGIEYTPLPGYWLNAPENPPDPGHPGVLAISATFLQGIYVRQPWDAMYAEIRTWQPREVLGGTIYIYDFPNPAMAQPRQ
jgi:hypothetical protein